MPSRRPHTTAALTSPDAALLRRALDGDRSVSVFVDGTAFRLPDTARDAVADLLERLASGEAVQCSSVEELLTTSQAADFAGISPTYLRNLTDAGAIPVEYRGSHRRIRRTDIEQWVARQRREHTQETSQPRSPSPPP